MRCSHLESDSIHAASNLQVLRITAVYPTSRDDKFGNLAPPRYRPIVFAILKRSFVVHYAKAFWLNDEYAALLHQFSVYPRCGKLF